MTAFDFPKVGKRLKAVYSAAIEPWVCGAYLAVKPTLLPDDNARPNEANFSESSFPGI